MLLYEMILFKFFLNIDIIIVYGGCYNNSVRYLGVYSMFLRYEVKEY